MSHSLGSQCPHPLTVIKLGGSLFDLSDLGERLNEFFNKFSFKHPVVIAGGGRFADEVRRLDQIHQLPEKSSHELGVRTLSISARFIESQSAQFVYADSEKEFIKLWDRQKIPIFDTAALALASRSLPTSWDVTSDSIAAALAQDHVDSKLILLKSITLSESCLSLQTAADLGFVDRHFPLAARDLSDVQWYNLRAKQDELFEWRTRVESSISYL